MDKLLQRRVDITASCKDSNYIPKVSNAGDVITLPSSGTPCQIMHNGLKVRTDSHYGDFNTEVIKRLRGHHEPQEEKVFYEVLKVIPENAVMLELGSFWAYYSMWFNKSVPGARNFMVEPMEPVLRYGIDNFELNGLRGDFTQACVGKESEAHAKFEHWDGTFHTRRRVTIDDLLREKGLASLDILHADIQGAEYDMLLGAQRSIATGVIAFIFVSTHSEGLHRKCLNFLLQNNYRLIAEHSPWASYAVDGLIAVHHPTRSFRRIQISKRGYWARVRSKISRFLRIEVPR